MSEPKKLSKVRQYGIARVQRVLADALAAGTLVTPMGKQKKTASGEIKKREWNAEHAEEIEAGKLVAFEVDELFIAAVERAAAAAAARPPKPEPVAARVETDEEAERNAREVLRDGGHRLDQRRPKSPFAESNWRGGGWRGGGIL